MKKYKLRLLCAILFIPAVLSSCKDEPDIPLEPAEKESLILLYAVAANNLESNLTSDLQEIISIGNQLDLSRNALLVYSVTRSGECKLRRFEKNSEGSYVFTDVKIYPDLPLSTSSERMKEVIGFVESNYRDYKSKGLILWSHGTGWLYWPQGSTPQNSKHKAFGQDDFEGSTYKTNIPELAEGIPAGMFDFIWFDCCYSANIETIYQLRNKTPFIVGSVIEIAAEGMPYNLTMPYLLKKDADLIGAATAFSEYFEPRWPYAISVVKTEKLPYLAEVTKGFLTQCEPPEDFNDIQNYSILYENGKRTTFYDLKQLLFAYSDITPEDNEETEDAEKDENRDEKEDGVVYGIAESLREALLDCLQETVLYSKVSDTNWKNSYISRPESIKFWDCSGLSMNYFIDSSSASSEFYKELDWYLATH